VISIYDRHLWLIEDGDTLHLHLGRGGDGHHCARKGATATTSPPRGAPPGAAKEEEPLWNPPDWHYYGLARRVRQFPGRRVALEDGRRVVRRGEQMGYLATASSRRSRRRSR
jgi:hypothetical protein